MKYCVVNYIFDKSEPVREPLVVDENCDYYLFTDDKEVKSKVWKVFYVEKMDNNTLPGYKKAYLIKNGFHYYIPNIQDYNYFVVMDGSILIKSSLNPIIDFMENRKYDVSVAIHPFRDNFMDEYNAWIQWRNLDPKWKDNFFKITSNERVKGNGLIETTVKIFKNSKETLDLLDDVHNTLYNGCRFDDNVEQIWFTHVLSKHLDKVRVNYMDSQLYMNSDYMLKYTHGSDDEANINYYYSKGGWVITFFEHNIRITDNSEYSGDYR